MVGYEDLERVCDIRNRSLQISDQLLIVNHDFGSFVNRTSYVCEVWTVHCRVAILGRLYVKNVILSINIYIHYIKAVRSKYTFLYIYVFKDPPRTSQ